MNSVNKISDFRRPITSWLLALVLMTSCHTYAQTRQQIILSTGTWLPYTGQELAQYGAASQIVSEAFALVGIDVKFQFYPWKRALELARRDVVNGSILWILKPEREQHFLFSDPVFEADIVFFYHKDRPFDWHSIHDLAGLNIGTVLGLKYQQDFSEAIDQGVIQTEDASTQGQNFHRLLAGRIDLTPIVKGSGYATIAENYQENQRSAFTHHEKPLTSQQFHLILNKRNKDSAQLLEDFNLGLTKLKQSGRYQQILSQVPNH